jgi:hypothetical protein
MLTQSREHSGANGGHQGTGNGVFHHRQPFLVLQEINDKVFHLDIPQGWLLSPGIVSTFAASPLARLAIS